MLSTVDRGRETRFLAVQLCLFLQVLLILPVLLAGLVRLLLAFALFLLLLVSSLSDLLKQVLALLFGFLTGKRGKGSGM